MRRSDKEITDGKLIGEILEKAEVIRLAMVDEGAPYIVPMNYAYADGFIYLHSASQGRKIDILKKNNKVAFQTETAVELILKENVCNSSARYLSVFGTGRAVLVEEGEGKKKALDAIMFKYTGRRGFKYDERNFERTLAIRVEIDSMTGKKSGF